MLERGGSDVDEMWESLRAAGLEGEARSRMARIYEQAKGEFDGINPKDAEEWAWTLSEAVPFSMHLNLMEDRLRKTRRELRKVLDLLRAGTAGHARRRKILAVIAEVDALSKRRGT